MANGIANTGLPRKFLRIGAGSTALTDIDAIGIGTWQMVNHGTMYFEEAMFEKGGSCQVEGVVVREKKGSGALIKANLLIMFLKYSDIVTACGENFAWTALTPYTAKIGEIEIETADYRDEQSAGAVYNASAHKILTKPIPIKVDEDWQRLFVVVVNLGSEITYSTGTELDIELIVNQD